MKNLLLFGCIVLFPLLAQAAISPWSETEQAKVRLLASGVSEQGGKPVLTAGLEIKLSDGWKTYWRSPGDAGMPPSLQFDGSSNTQAEQARLDWPFPKRHVDVSGLQDFIYHDRVLLPLTIPLENGRSDTKIKLKLDYLVCNTLCVPLSADLTLNIPANEQDSATGALIAAAAANVPAANGTGGLKILSSRLQKKEQGAELEVEVASTQGWNVPDIIVEGNARFLKPRVLPEPDNHARFVIPVEGNIEKLTTDEPLRLTLINNDSQAVTATIPALISSSFQPVELAATATAQQASASLFAIMLVAVLGGLILNIMPCVLPVLSIKLLGIIRHGGAERHAIRASFLASAAGIIVSFLLIAGGLILLQTLGHTIGFGFQFQHPLFLIALVLVLVMFACNLWGLFEIHMPAWLGRLALRHNDHTLLGAFFTGAFATLLATPCSAPFVGTAISFALSRGPLEIILIFAAMGVGLALPYLLLSIVPGWVSLLPKPGSWMQKVRFILGVALIATALWLIWVLSNQLGTSAALLLLLLCLLLKFALETHTGILQNNWARGGMMAAVIGMAFLLPLKTYEFNKAQAQLAGEIWRPFDEAAIAGIISTGKIVVVDVTADWCLTCKINKLTLFERFDILERFKQPDIVAMRADLTSPNPVILDYLKRFKRYGIPFNVVYGPAAPKGIPLSELPSKGELMLAMRQAAGKE